MASIWLTLTSKPELSVKPVTPFTLAACALTVPSETTTLPTKTVPAVKVSTSWSVAGISKVILLATASKKTDAVPAMALASTTTSPFPEMAKVTSGSCRASNEMVS